MNILILGAGEVGFNIAQRLAIEGSDVVVVDLDQDCLQRVSDSMDVKTVWGNAAHPSILAQAGAEHTDLLIAATTNDEVNMIACQVAHSLYQVPTKIARVREADYINAASKLFGRDDLPIDHIIFPEQEAARAIVKRVQISAAVDAQDFSGGKVQLIGLRVAPKTLLAGLQFNELQDVLQNFQVYMVAHEHNRRWRVPNGDDVILAGDSLYAAVKESQVELFLQEVGPACTACANKSVMILGGGNVGFLVAQALEKMNIIPKIIEQNPDRARWLAEHLNKTTVILGSALDRELLEEENIDRMDDFLALTNDDETNILASLIAKKYKVGHIVTLVNRAIYNDLIYEMGLDVTVSPRLTTVSSILSHIRKGRVLGTACLGDGSLEVIEAEALETSAILNAPLMNLDLPPQTVVGAVVRGDEVIIPNGHTHIQAHDHVLMVTTHASIPAVEQLFQVHLEFF